MIERLVAGFRLHRFRRVWRRLNRHNFTVPNNVFDATKVEVGAATYGDLVVDMFSGPGERLEIGHYVSIGNGVRFLLGGGHNLDTFSTYPFRVRILGEVGESTTRGSVVVCDDVWIGAYATILPGVTIGQGAVVGTGAVVAKDIEPYAICAGNPAKLIRFRFSDDLIAELLRIDFSQVTPDFVSHHAADLYAPLDRARLSKLRAGLNKLS